MEKTKKKVHFSNIIMIYEIDNSEEHRSARNGLQDLRDRHRFRRRIENIEITLNNVLKMKYIKYLFNILPYSDIC